MLLDSAPCFTWRGSDTGTFWRERKHFGLDIVMMQCYLGNRVFDIKTWHLVETQYPSIYSTWVFRGSFQTLDTVTIWRSLSVDPLPIAKASDLRDGAYCPIHIWHIRLVFAERALARPALTAALVQAKVASWRKLTEILISDPGPRAR